MSKTEGRVGTVYSALLEVVLDVVIYSCSASKVLKIP